jgi:glycerol-3-phosphate acyltransferase PlsY
MAFWPWIGAIAIPDVLFFVLVVGYASVASLSTALVVVITFAIRAAFFSQPWEYVIYGLMTSVLVIWALRPNIQRLINGTERRVGVFARKKE